MNLKYVTRGDSSPNGRQRVYISYHEKDAGMFEELSQKLRDLVDVAVYRDVEPRFDDDLSELEEFQLIIMIVSSNWLFHKNRSFNRELAFAKEKNVPVLPILIDDGIQKEFNDKTDNMHYIKKSDFEYNEKFKAQIEIFLLNDETVKLIREQAFDGTIFISYRKIDKALARQVMKDIHKVKCCEYFAIWYDEFLVAGKSWDKSIKQSIKNCDLFSMVITPNITKRSANGKKNYVLKKEYPLARRKFKKTILPIEAQETKRKKVYKKYKKLPEIVVSGSQEMESRLKQVVGKKYGTAPSSNDELYHKYLMGLAFLRGIDVEKDVERSVELLTESAKGENFEATKQLVEIYNNGIGVSRDRNKAIEWQEKAVEIIWKQYENEPSRDLACSYLFERWMLVCWYEDSVLSEKVCMESIRFALEYYKEDKYDGILNRLADHYNKMAGIRYKQENKNEDFKESERYYKKAMRIRAFLAGKYPNSFEYQLMYVESCTRVAGIKGVEEGFEYHIKALNIMEEFVEKYERSVRSLNKLASLNMNLARSMELKKMPNYKKYYKSAYEIFKELYEMTEDKSYKEKCRDLKYIATKPSYEEFLADICDMAGISPSDVRNE